jgi:hypothetical protein
MKFILILEEAAMAAFGLYMLSFFNLGLSTWIWALLFFSPDFGMVGYLVNSKVGAFTYNLFHHKGIAIGLGIAGYLISNEIMTAIGILLFAHSSFDRIFGYGLKYSDSFQHTHLGRIGKVKHR